MPMQAHEIEDLIRAAFPEAHVIEDDRPIAVGGGGRNWRR